MHAELTFVTRPKGRGEQTPAIRQRAVGNVTNSGCDVHSETRGNT